MPFTFTFAHQRGIIGNDFSVNIKTDSGDRLIQRVDFSYDGYSLDSYTPNLPETSSTISFREKGGFTPNRRHTFLVTVTDSNNQYEHASYSWEDA